MIAGQHVVGVELVLGQDMHLRHVPQRLPGDVVVAVRDHEHRAPEVTDGAERNVLVVTEHDDELSWKSLRNVPFVHLLAEDQLNTYDVLASDFVVFTKAALDAFVERGSE